MKHPMQYQENDNGVQRFVENKLVIWLIDSLGDGLNDLCREYSSGDYDVDDYDQILQLIGYSVSSIPYIDKTKYLVTDKNCKPDLAFEIEYKNLKDSLRPIISNLFDIAEGDLS